jgi:hypothetical protein
VLVGRLPMPLNGIRRLLFIVPSRAVPPVALRRMLETAQSLAEVLNVPLHIRADPAYAQVIEALLVRAEQEQEPILEMLPASIPAAYLEQEDAGSFVILPGFGSRKRVADTLGNLPERLAGSFQGNLAVLHFDQ